MLIFRKTIRKKSKYSCDLWTLRRHCHSEQVPDPYAPPAARRVPGTARSGIVWPTVLLLWIINRQILTNQSWCNNPFVFFLILFSSSHHFISIQPQNPTNRSFSLRRLCIWENVNNTPQYCHYKLHHHEEASRRRMMWDVLFTVAQI